MERLVTSQLLNMEECESKRNTRIIKIFLLQELESDEMNVCDDDVTPEVIRHLLSEKRISRQRISDYFNVTIPGYSPDEFSSHFRMRRETFEEVCRQILSTGHIPKEHVHGREIIEPSKQVMISIWMLANMEGYRQISDRFNVTYSSVYRCFMRTCTALQCLSVEKIKWPTGARANEVIEGFENLMGFPRVLGAVDGCHVQIKAPQEKYHPMSYLNRKRDYSVILQAVCDHTLRFTDIVSGWPGSVHDARVFKNSPLYEANENLFPGDTHIVGDAAYPLQSWILTPYKDTGNLAECHKRYNFIHSNTRQMIERAFGLLKGKWRRLRFLEMTKLEDVPSVITAACTLHNMCIDNNDNDLDMCNDTSIFPDAPAVGEPLNQSGSVKRNALAQYFWSTNR
ncbi:uncharacterized protein LOC134249338 [Saccostrea cucullata]|uniref:uncharacterized protein LOC134240469 n=2 Tax=Saccostrea cuccullata TaxID=36930 RepID=UPI002ED5EB2A